MREIAAASDFDFVASEPAPKGKKSRARAAKPRAASAPRGPNWLRRLWVWRTPMFGGTAFLLLLSAIAVNAMFLQRGRHPAPLMGATLRLETQKPVIADVAPEALAPTPMSVAPVKPASAALEPAPQAAPPVVAPVVAPKPVVAAKLAAPAKPAAASAKKTGDAIGALLASEQPTAPARSKVAAAQKALQKLGAHLDANGQFNGATKKAVEKFQRDNGLPVTGALTPKLEHFMALQAGLEQ